jgi:hypothetical protein
MTKAGPLDLLGTIGENQGFDELLDHVTELRLGRNQRVRILNLDTLIEMKELFAREKDKAVLPVLRRTLQEKTKLRR